MVQKIKVVVARAFRLTLELTAFIDFGQPAPTIATVFMQRQRSSYGG
jgi:hypothetical protein